MTTVKIQKDTVDFLNDLAQNNNRDWFNAQKGRYLEAHGNIIAFADALIAEMNKHDMIETASGKKGVYRIYKDVRFSKEKTPYNKHWSCSLKRATKKLRGGYYFRIEPGNSFIAAGFWGPEPDDMKRIRQHIDANYDDWRALFAHKVLIKTFGGLTGEQLATAPRGYAKDHPGIDLLQRKQFVLKYPIADEDIFNPDLLSRVNELFKKMRPFLDFMSEVLTTDANGVSVVE